MRKRLAACMLCALLGTQVAPTHVLGASSRQGNVRVARAITDSYVVVDQKGNQQVQQVRNVDPTRIQEQIILEQTAHNGNSAAFGSDVFTRNRLTSPLCSQLRFTVLSAEKQRNCVQTGIAAATAPVSNLQFDKIVDTAGGPADLVPKPDGIFTSIILSITNGLWSFTLHVTHAVFFAIEWAFGFNVATNGVLQSAGKIIGGIFGRVLFVFMGLGSVVCGIWIMWVGGVRKHSSRAIKHALQVFLVLTGSLVVLANPVGTIGSISGFSSQIGTWLLSLSTGNLDDDRAGLERANQALYRGVVLPATAQMMFGDVDFGANPKRLNPALKIAARKLAKHEQPSVRKRVEAARTNVELFAVWRANSPQRTQFGSQDDTPVDGILKFSPIGAAANVASDALHDGDGDPLDGEKSLLAVLCDGESPGKCKSKYADIVSWQTENDVWERVIGFAFVGASLFVFCLVCGSIAMVLLAANVMMVVHLLQLAVASSLALFGSTGFHRLVDISKQLLLSATAAIGCGATLGIITSLWTVINQVSGLGFVLSWILIMLGMIAVFVKRKTLWGTKRVRREISKRSRVFDRVRPAPRLAQRTAYGMAVGFAGSQPSMQHLPFSSFSSLGVRNKSRSALQEQARRYTQTHARTTQNTQPTQPVKPQARGIEDHHSHPASRSRSGQTPSEESSGREGGVEKARKFAAGMQPVLEGYAVGGVAGGIGAAGTTVAQKAAKKRLNQTQEPELPPTISITPSRPHPKPSSQPAKQTQQGQLNHGSLAAYHQQQHTRQTRQAHQREMHLATQDQKIPSSSVDSQPPVSPHDPHVRPAADGKPAVSRQVKPEKDVPDRVLPPPVWQQVKQYRTSKDERE